MEGWREALRSGQNHFLWRLRERIRFQRAGYGEAGAEPPGHPEARRLEAIYGLAPLRPRLTPAAYEKNLATLYVLEQTLGGLPIPLGPLAVLEPGAQDFARLPAYRAYLRARGAEPRITGLEVDAFPVLRELHSRADKAAYYLTLPRQNAADRYVAGDFFTWREEPGPLVICFYPFVSADPALAWGLPRDFGRPEAWVRAFVRNLAPGGRLLVVHQGEWEEEEFDDARTGAPLRLERRLSADCPFYPLPHPARASVYLRE